MFIVRDNESYSNPYLIFWLDRWMWGKDRGDAYRFTSEKEALETGKAAMPTPEMEYRVVVDPA